MLGVLTNYVIFTGMDSLRTLIKVIVESENKSKHSEHLVKTGIDLIVNEFICHAHKEMKLEEFEGDIPLDEQVELAAIELKNIIETAYIDIYGRLYNGKFRSQELYEGKLREHQRTIRSRNR